MSHLASVLCALTLGPRGTGGGAAEGPIGTMGIDDKANAHGRRRCVDECLTNFAEAAA